MRRIVIVGGGFGGVTTAQRLQKHFKNNAEVEITLVNRENFMLFVPMLASAAAGSIDTLHAVAPIRRMAKHINFREEEVLGIDLRNRQVATTSRITGRESLLPFDHLVLALGNTINLSSLPGLAQHGQTMKSLGDALHLRNHVIGMLEAADIETDPVLRQEMLTFVVAGAGYSGVETIGELNDLVHSIAKNYRAIPKESLKLILLHSGKRILPEMPESLAEFALKKLRQRGVEVRLETRIAAATPREAILKSGERIPTRTLVVTVGSAPNPILAPLTQLPREKGRIITDQFMQVPGVPGVWALGDCAAVPNGSANGDWSPPTAQYAIRQAPRLADNLKAALYNHPDKFKSFAFPGLGQLCLVGHHAGVAEMLGGIKLSGFIAWWMWRNIYLAKFPSWDRKVRIRMNWTLDTFLPRDLTRLDLSRSQVVNQVHYEPGDFVFRQGDVGDHFFVIVSGEVEVFKEGAGGQIMPMARLGAGEFFGETALLNGKRRSASVRAVGPVDLMALGRDEFNSLAGSWLKFSQSIQSLAAERNGASDFDSRLLEASRDFRTLFATSFLGNLAKQVENEPPVSHQPPAISYQPNNNPPPPINGQSVVNGYQAGPVSQPQRPSGPVSNSQPMPNYANPAGYVAKSNPVPAFALPPAARLIRNDGSELFLQMPEMTIGRNAENHIVLADKQTSRYHAVLTQQGNGYVISDKGTSNGTYVNGMRITTQPLHDGDQITIGSTTFTYRAG